MFSRRGLILSSTLGVPALIRKTTAAEVASGPVQEAPINVRRFGAKGDGESNDTAAIQGAIDEAVRRGGGLVYLPAGRYKIVPEYGGEVDRPARCGLVVAGDNVTILGDGADVTVLHFRVWGDKDPSTNWQLVKTDKAEPGPQVWRGNGILILGGKTAETARRNITFRDFTFDGGAYPGNTRNKGIPAAPDTGDNWDVTHKGICIEPNTFHDNIVIEYCHLHNWRGEIIYGGGPSIDNVRIRHCRLHSTNGDAVSVSAALEVSNCEISDCAHAGAECFHLGKKAVYQDNIIKNVDIGINIQSDYNSDNVAIIRNNTIQNCRLFGVLLNVENGPTEICDNQFIDAATGSITAAAIEISPGRGLKKPVIAGVRILRNRIMGHKEFNGTGIGLSCYNPNAELRAIIIEGNTIERSIAAESLGKDFKIPISYNLRAGTIRDIVITNNVFNGISRDIENTAAVPAQPAPLLTNNRSNDLREFSNNYYVTNGVDETVLKNETCFIMADNSGHIPTPVLDPRRYARGQEFFISAQDRKRPIYFPVSEVYRCAQGRLVTEGTWLKLKVIDGAFLEIAYHDQRRLPAAEIAEGPILTMEGYPTGYLSPKTTPHLYEDFSGIGEGAAVRIIARVSGVTIAHNGRIRFKGGRDYRMKPLEILQFYLVKDGPLIET